MVPMKTKSNALERHKGVYISKIVELEIGKTTIKDWKGKGLKNRKRILHSDCFNSVELLTPL